MVVAPDGRIYASAEMKREELLVADIDLSKAGQFDSEFLKINPKHEVPAFVHDDEYITCLLYTSPSPRD